MVQRLRLYADNGDDDDDDVDDCASSVEHQGDEIDRSFWLTTVAQLIHPTSSAS